MQASFEGWKGPSYMTSYKSGEAKWLRAEGTDNMLETYYRRDKHEGRHK